MSLFFPFLSLWKGQTSTNLLGDKVVEWLWKSCFTTIFAPLTLWPAMLLTLVLSVHPYTCASIPLCSSKFHLADAENQKENQVLCQGKEHVFLPVLGAYFCCLVWFKSQLSFHVGTVCHSMHRRVQELVSKPQKRSHVSSWNKVVWIPSLKHKAFSNIKPEMNTWKWEQDWSSIMLEISFKSVLYHEWMDLRKCK